MAKVVITEGPGSGTEYEIERAAILGRLDTNDIPVRDKKASREHAKIYQQGQQFAIVDLNSSNGTWIKIWERSKLHDNDFIFMGQQLFRVRVEGRRR